MIDHAADLNRKARKRRSIGLCALAAIGVMLAWIVATGFWSAAERRQAQAWRVHSLDVLLTAGQLETAVNAALRGERGYLITGNPDFLKPYLDGRRDGIASARHLRVLTRDNETQQRNLVTVERRLGMYLAIIDRLVMLEQAGRHREAIATVRSGLGRRQIEEFLAALHRVEHEERRLLDLRSAQSAAAEALGARNNYIFAAAAALLMALLTAAILSATRAHRRALELTEELHQLATTDGLTGLPNRRQLMFALETEVRRAGRTGRPLALALLDIDHFKAINDTHGHPAGDAVLVAVAEVLREVTRGGDVLGRFGGEEFAVLMPETSLDQAQLACERLRRAIQKRRMDYPNGAAGHITISTGVARLAGEEGLDHLIHRADIALYEAKAGGRNLVKLAA
ncbi:MAG TPA: diguanylate cyclase [Allosphingosinicella sp.]|nr:diguanylate cyclase [Allosphingosinicella sp.]